MPAGEVRREYRKIYWPPNRETFHITVIVLLVTIFAAFLVLALDTALAIALNYLTGIIEPFLNGF